MIDIFRPEQRPRPSTHFEALSEFKDWLKQPSVNPRAFPAASRDVNEPLGAWVYICSSKWADRYDVLAIRSKVYKVGAEGTLTPAIIAFLGYFGLDGELLPGELIPSAVAFLARIGVPMPLTGRELNCKRTKELLDAIKEHYHAK